MHLHGIFFFHSFHTQRALCAHTRGFFHCFISLPLLFLGSFVLSSIPQVSLAVNRFVSFRIYNDLLIHAVAWLGDLFFFLHPQIFRSLSKTPPF